ncbi:MAG: transposase [Woeseiaceae bacterium]|nr:transposase [Woeseiaceae bacterium]
MASPRGHRLRSGRHSSRGSVYFITSCCRDRSRVFDDPLAAAIVLRELRVASEVECKTLASVVMPDHIHWLLQITCDLSLSAIVGRFKGRSSRRVNQLRQATTLVWQRGFHDRMIRQDEHLEAAGRYLIYNPVRAGLVQCVDDYPYWSSVWHGRP